MLTAALLSSATALSVGCGGNSGASAKVDTPKAAAAPTAPAPTPVPGEAAEAKPDIGEEAPDYLPAEFKAGASKWRDVGVYVDGKPVGMLSFGELPVALKPVWVKEKISVEKTYGEPGDGTAITEQRRYRFTDYLAAVGVDLKKVKQVHVYGPRFSQTIIVTGEELRARGKTFRFRFGGEVQGKPIPDVPEDFGNGKSPDKISAVMVYVDKEPPVLVHNKGLVLNGEVQDAVPYGGEPVRGGVRVYFDDRLVAVVKRRLLDELKLPTTNKDGHITYSLFQFLETQGVDTKLITEAYVIRGDQRREKLSRAELESATFEADAQAKGEILIGDKKYRAQVLAFHSRRLKGSELPTFRAHEEPEFEPRPGEE
jgi:hypothetical protein